MYSDTNIIGSRGEMISTAILMTNEIFYAELIGGKAPSFDIYVEIHDADKPYPFLIQIKTTTQSDMYNSSSIKTPVDDPKLQSLVRRPIPTYVGGLDMNNNILYLASAFSGKEHYSSIPLNHKLELFNPQAAVVELQILREDVIRFYDSNNIPNQKINFKSSL